MILNPTSLFGERRPRLRVLICGLASGHAVPRLFAEWRSGPHLDHLKILAETLADVSLSHRGSARFLLAEGEQ